MAPGRHYVWAAAALAAAVSLGVTGRGRRRSLPAWRSSFLRGKPVRPRTAIIRGALVAILVFTAGLHSIRAEFLGYYPENSGLGEENWGTTAPGLLWPLWGVALGAAVLEPCSRCGRL